MSSSARAGPTFRKWKNSEDIAKAIETGLPKMRIEEAAARRQAAIDSGKEPIIGVNKYRLEQESPRSIFWKWTTPPSGKPRSPACRNCARNGTPPPCEAALEALSECARTGEGNLLDLAIKAAKARASLGEILLRPGKTLRAS